MRSRNSAVLARSSSSESRLISGSSALIGATIGVSRLRMRSFEVPKILARNLSKLKATTYSKYQCKWQRRKRDERRGRRARPSARLPRAGSGRQRMVRCVRAGQACLQSLRLIQSRQTRR